MKQTNIKSTHLHGKASHWGEAFQLGGKTRRTCTDLMHMLSRWKEPDPRPRNASIIVPGRRCYAVKQELRNRTRGQMSLRSQLPEILPTETRDSISNFVLNSRNMSSSESKPQRAAESRRSRRRCIKAGTFEVLVVRIATTASLSDRKRTCFLAHKDPQR